MILLTQEGVVLLAQDSGGVPLTVQENMVLGQDGVVLFAKLLLPQQFKGNMV